MASLNVLNEINKTVNHLKDLPGICFKPKQVKCLEYLLHGIDVVAVLPTGYGKSLIYQLLPFVIPTKNRRNIVIVVCPLTAIIEDQLKYLSNVGIKAEVLNLQSFDNQFIESLFSMQIKSGLEDQTMETVDKISDYVRDGDIDVLFAHPESLLCIEGRNLMKSKVFKENVISCVVDEVHCVEAWLDLIKIYL